MPTYNTVITDLQTLDPAEQEWVLNYLEQVLILGPQVAEVTEEIKENRFSRGKVCPHCSHEEVTRNGKYNGKQRYICKSCKKTFTDFSRSPHHGSKKDISKWLQYAKCMIVGYSIRECAGAVCISIPTAFYWRHKILDAIRLFMGIGSVGGVIEVDEVFFRESFKGNHKRNPNFKMGRQSFKRGVKGSQSGEGRKRGISQNQVCVVSAIDRTGNIIIELACKGRIRHADLERLFNNRIDDDSILCADSHRSYIKFANNLGIELHQIKSGKHKEGVYHIQHINAFHSKLKKWMRYFNGVSTKYLANYMCWFKWLEFFKTERDVLKGKQLLVQAHTTHSDTKIRDFKDRKPVFV